jgi:hypothetical protein
MDAGGGDMNPSVIFSAGCNSGGSIRRGKGLGLGWGAGVCGRERFLDPCLDFALPHLAMMEGDKVFFFVSRWPSVRMGSLAAGGKNHEWRDIILRRRDHKAKNLP